MKTPSGYIKWQKLNDSRSVSLYLQLLFKTYNLNTGICESTSMAEGSSNGSESFQIHAWNK